LAARNPDIIVPGFKAHIPFWGGKINFRGKERKLVNTCCQDNFQFFLWVLSKLVPTFLRDIPEIPETKNLIEMIKFIDEVKWNSAKEHFIVKIMNYNKINNQKELSFFGSEYSNFLDYLKKFQIYSLTQVCTVNCIYNGAVLGNDLNYKIELIKNQNHIEINKVWRGTCPICKFQVDAKILFEKNPNFIFVSTLYNDFIFNDLPKYLNIENKRFKLLGATALDKETYKIGHFISIIELNNDLFVVNAIGQRCEYLPPFYDNILNQRKISGIMKYHKLNIGTAVYYLI